MAKLKIKDIEGDPKDIHELFQSGGCDLPSYIGAGAKNKMLSAWWIVGVTLLFFILACCIWTELFNLIWTKVSILGLFLSCFLIIILVQYNYRNYLITILSAAAGVAIILMALNIYSPAEIAKKMESITQSHYKKR